MEESQFIYPTREGASEVAQILGVDVEAMTKCQDWEYTFPRESELPVYFSAYQAPTTSPLAKRVLASFILQCLEDLVSSELVFSPNHYLEILFQDISILRTELEYWGNVEDLDDHELENGWAIAPAIRRYLAKADENSQSSGN